MSADLIDKATQSFKSANGSIQYDWASHALQRSRPTEINHSIRNFEEVQACNATVVGNTTNCTFPVLNDEAAKASAAATTFILAILGNGCVIAVLLPRWRILTRLHHFMLNLSIADMFVALLTILPQWLTDLSEHKALVIGGDPLCKFVRFIQLFPLYGSSYILVMTAVDRFIAICYPLKNYSWTKKRTYLSILLAWTIAFFLASPQVFLFSSQYDSKLKMDKCNHAWDALPEWTVTAYTFYYIGFTFIIPLIVLIVTYGCISYTVWINVISKTKPAHKKNGIFRTGDHSVAWIGRSSSTNCKDPLKKDKSIPRSHSRRAFSRAKMKTVTLTFVVVCAFILCWAPYSVMMIWWASDKSLAEDPTIGHVLAVFALLTTLNSCCNPYIYILFTYTTIKRFLPCYKRNDKMKFYSNVSNTLNTSYQSGGYKHDKRQTADQRGQKRHSLIKRETVSLKLENGDIEDRPIFETTEHGVGDDHNNFEFSHLKESVAASANETTKQ